MYRNHTFTSRPALQQRKIGTNVIGQLVTESAVTVNRADGNAHAPGPRDDQDSGSRGSSDSSDGLESPIP